MLNSLIDLMTFVCFFRGEIKDLFERVTREELEMSVLSGDKKKQNQMRYLLQALPYHTEEIDTLEKLARNAATTQAPQVQPEVPSELKELLKNYGLLDKNGNPVELSPLPVTPNANYPFSQDVDNLAQLEGIQDVQQAALVSAKDYEAFKPIEANKQNVSSEMESFLKQFGLLDNADTKKRKTNKTQGSSKNPSIDAAYLNSGHSSLLDNIGVTIDNKNGVKSALKTASKPDYKKAGDDDYKKLEQLLETIRELEKLNTTLTEKEVERLNLQNYNFSDSLMSEIGPDPLAYNLQYGALRNEVKRQNPTEEPTRVSLGLTSDGLLESSLEDTDGTDEDKETETTSTKTESTSEPASTTTTEAPSTTTATSASSTEEAKKNNLEDEIEPVEDPEPLPPPRRSGFYMLFDWNTFLEVGEDPDKIIVRFDPKIGDPSRFLPVSVP